PAGDYEVRIVNENGTVFQTISLEILPAYTFFLPTFIIGETIDYGDGTIRLPYATETNEAYIGTYFGYKIVAEGSDGARYESDMLTATGSDMGITLDAPNYNGEGAEIELYYIKDGENRFITSYTKEG
ncbi:MAG: hypothetical protein HUJ60_04785, partial [Bacilli bacterium]|nr:hypothetical protein [Bacilli bacterium]